MEIEKAIKHFKNMKEKNFAVLNDFKKEIEMKKAIGNNNIDYSTSTYENRDKYYSLAIQALEKQVSKNPKRIKFDEHISNLNCPSCDCVLFTEFSDGISAGEKVNFCPECGQAIDWSDEQ